MYMTVYRFKDEGLTRQDFLEVTGQRSAGCRSARAPLREAQILDGTNTRQKTNEEKACLRRIECAQVELISRQIGM
jgi:hypothetical protein